MAKEVLYKYFLQFLVILLMLRMIPESTTLHKFVISLMVIVLFYLFDIKLLTIEPLTSLSNFVTSYEPPIVKDDPKNMVTENNLLDKKINDKDYIWLERNSVENYSDEN